LEIKIIISRAWLKRKSIWLLELALNVEYKRPMSYCSTDTSSSHDNGMKGEVLGSRTAKVMCNLLINKMLNIKDKNPLNKIELHNRPVPIFYSERTYIISNMVCSI